MKLPEAPPSWPKEAHGFVHYGVVYHEDGSIAWYEDGKVVAFKPSNRPPPQNPQKPRGPTWKHFLGAVVVVPLLNLLWHWIGAKGK